MKNFKNLSNFLKKFFRVKKTKKRILSLMILLLVLTLSFGVWSFKNFNKSQKITHKTENQNQQSSDTPNPTIQGTGTGSPQTETTSITQKNNAGNQVSQQPNKAVIPPTQSSNPTPSPTPDNQWCEWYKEQQRQALIALYQIKINEENQRYRQEVAEINAEYNRRGLWSSGMHLEALRQVEESHNNKLLSIDYWYQGELRKIDYLY